MGKKSPAPRKKRSLRKGPPRPFTPGETIMMAGTFAAALFILYVGAALHSWLILWLNAILVVAFFLTALRRYLGR